MATEDKQTSPTDRDSSGEAAPVISPQKPCDKKPAQREVDGPSGPEPTRYGDWEKNGRCIDF